MEYLKLPNFLLKGYVKKHYSEFSYEDFLNVVDRVKIPALVLITNNKLLNNKDVLLKLLDVNPGVFRVFPESLMDEDVLNKLKPLYKKVFNVSDATQYKYLLNIEEVRVDFIREYPAYINYIDSKYYDKDLINLYIDSYKGEIDLNIFKDRLDLLNDSELVIRIAKNNQSVIFLVDFISDELAYLVINKGIDLTLEDFKVYPQLGKSMPLVNHVLKTIPDVVRYIDPSLCNPYLFSDAIEYGFKIQEEDLKNNDLFRNISSVMEAAVKINPSWIKYIGENCFMHSIYLDRALLEYDITLEDIYNNPDITKNFGLMCRLDGYKLYSKFLYDEIKKEEIINAIKEGRTLVNSGLPFLDKRFSTLVDVDKLQELYDSLNDNKSDEDIKVQESTYLELLNIIDNVIELRYLSDKVKNNLGDFDKLNKYIMGVFESCNGDIVEIHNCALKLYDFVGKRLDLDYIKEQLKTYYDIFRVKRDVPKNLTTDFYNQLLNTYKTTVVSKENAFIRSDIRYNLNLTDKKINSIMTGKRRKKLTNLIKNGRFNELGYEEHVFANEITYLFIVINSNKELLKKGIQINQDTIDKFIDVILKNGDLTLADVIQHINTDDTEVISYVFKYINRYLSELSGSLGLSEDELKIDSVDKEGIELSYKDYKIRDNDRVLSTIVSLLIKVDYEQVNKILNNKECLDSLRFLIPYIDMFDEFKLSTFINMLLNYDRVKSRFRKTLGVDKLDQDFILRHLKDFMMLSNAYSSANNLAVFGLGENVCDVLEDYRINIYYSFYLRMLENKSGYIPNVLFNGVNYSCSSGCVSDADRLLIGKKPSTASCIDLGNCAGEDTYRDVLLGKTGEVVLVKDSNNEIVNRIFLFRRGNVVQLVSSAGANSGFKIYQAIADQIMEQAIANNDNIDYVIVNGEFKNEDTSMYKNLYTRELINGFPHADFTPNGYVLASRTGDDIEFKFDEDMKVMYKKRRGDINYSPSDIDITRLNALYISLLKDDKYKEELARNFEPVYLKDFDKVVCGDDWYIAIKGDEVTEIMLATSNEDSIEEMLIAKNELGISEVKGMSM